MRKRDKMNNMNIMQAQFISCRGSFCGFSLIIGTIISCLLVFLYPDKNIVEDRARLIDRLFSVAE